MYDKYAKFIEKRLKLVDKNGEYVTFEPNAIQKRFMHEATGRDIVLKARQQGFSSLILAIFTADFILKENSRSIVVADIADNALELLDRVKMYLRSYQEITGQEIPLKYNSKYELYNETMNSRYTIGTAKNADFGRSKTITNLHLSEAAFYPDLTKMMAGIENAVVPDGRVVIETTANGFNEFKTFWDQSTLGETGYEPLFYPASEFYTQDFLDKKKKTQGRLYDQEYPETAATAFVTSGQSYFALEPLAWYLDNVREPVT